ncbi:hypothetical protein [Halotalea alkalilenta]|uniref:hypothetical protein n=1 Tax=Halotalea alkalilenta TaxID=376489 RepID=UPI00167FFA62|nr:hypothetical protein [Halotalea alkalilenta]
MYKITSMLWPSCLAQNAGIKAPTFFDLCLILANLGNPFANHENPGSDVFHPLDGGSGDE